MALTDISNVSRVQDVLRYEKPDVVINCAGKTGRPNVDWCETHRDETCRSNTVGPLVLAEECARANAYLLHLGSGCVFYGPSPHPGGWRENDFANPVSFYSRTKYAADLVLSELPNVAVVRLRMPIDGKPNPRNLITKLAGYRQVIDVENSVTVVKDLVRVVQDLIERRAVGVFHACNPGTLRHTELLRLYKEIVDPGHEYELIGEEELTQRGLAVAARSNAILASTRHLGVDMRPVDEAVRDAMTEYAR